MNADTRTPVWQGCRRCAWLPFLLFALPRSACAGAGPSLAPAELDLGRVYRGVRRAFSLEADAPPEATLTLDISPPVTPAGGRAVGVSIRRPGRRLETGADGRLVVECEIAAIPGALLGPASFKVTLTDEVGRSAVSMVSLVVSRRRLAAPARLEFGEAFIRGRARTELALRMEGPEGASAWLEWSGLLKSDGGHRAEILRAFVGVGVGERAVELPAEEDVKVLVEIELPRGTRPGEYRGTLTVVAGPCRAAIELAVRAILPRMAAEPDVLEIGTVAAGELATAAFTVRLEGAAPERFEAELEGPLSKTSRPEALFDALEVETARDEIAPGEEVRVNVFGTVPAGQEDGSYEGVMILRAGASRHRLPVSIEVPRPEGLPRFELEPLELVIRVRRGENAHAALRVVSHVDRALTLEARLTPPGDPGWILEFGGDSLSPDQYAFLVPGRGEAEIPIVARAPEGAPLGRCEEARVEVAAKGADEGVSARSDVKLRVARAAPRPRPARPSPAPRIALTAFAVACALAAAASWKIRPVRYGAASAGAHALALAFGVSSPFMSAPARIQAGERPIAIQVIQLDIPYGEESPAGTEGEAVAAAEPRAAREAESGTLPRGRQPPVFPGQELEAAAEGGVAVPIPSHPDAPARAELRESLEVARAPVPSPGPTATRDSDGFDLEGPAAVLSLAASGEIRRASYSGEPAFGALWRHRVPGVLRRGRPSLVEEVPAGAIAAAVEEPQTHTPTPGRPWVSPRTSEPRREAVEFAAPRPREVGRATLVIARRKPPDVPPIPLRRPALRELPREEAPEIAARHLVGHRRSRTQAARRPDGPAEERERVRRPTAVRHDTARRPHTPRPEPARPQPTPVERAKLARQTPRLDLPVAGARDPVMDLANRPAESVSVTGGKRAPPERPPETRGRQTITHARGRWPAGVEGRLEQSFTRRALASPRELLAASRPPRTPLVRTGGGEAAAKLLAPSRGSLARGRARAVRAGVLLGTLKHAGEWNVSPRAMTALAKELPSRQPGFNLDVRAMPVRATEPDLFDCALVYVTGRRAPDLSEHELERLTRYIRQGGFLWVDDGAPPGDSTFARAARSLLRRLAETLASGGASPRRVPFSNDVFTSSYDLARGYLGRAVPAGAWTRQDELEGLFTPEGKLVAVYTRNGYGVAMELDPNRESDFRPPAGLTPREAREGALRTGVNIAVFALRSGPCRSFLEETLPRARARETFDPSLRYRYRGDGLTQVRDVWSPASWREMRDSGPVKVGGQGGALALEFLASEKDWAGVESAAPAARRWAPGLLHARAVVFDVECIMRGSARVALRLRTAGGTLYESVPLYVHPGLNENLRVPLDAAEFRSSATGWRAYDAPWPRRPGQSDVPAVVGFVFYSRDLDGSAILARLRFEGWAAAR